MRTGAGERRRGSTGRVSLPTVVVVTQGVIALLTATAGYAAWRPPDGDIQAGGVIAHRHGKRVPKKDEQVPTEPLNILVLGTDTRSGAGDAIDGEAGCNCSDTTMLVHLSAD